MFAMDRKPPLDRRACPGDRIGTPRLRGQPVTQRTRGSAMSITSFSSRRLR